MKLFVLIILLSICNLSHAQKNDYIWLTGSWNSGSTVIDFNYPNDSIYSNNRTMPLLFPFSSMCNNDGQLLFYTNGIYIADSSHQMMQNGDSLNPGQISSGSTNSQYPTEYGELILPIPQRDSMFVLFHTGVRYFTGVGLLPDKFYYTMINMNLNNGKGGVTLKNQLLMTDTVQNLQAVLHGNGVDWWVLIPEVGNNYFHSFLVTKDSILGPFTQQTGRVDSMLDGGSQSVFSPDGTKYAYYESRNQIEFFDFDRCTGLLSNFRLLSPTPPFFNRPGLAFSPNSRYLYANTPNFVFQYDTWATDIEASKDTIGVFDGFMLGNSPVIFTYAQLAPNGKIYIVSGSEYWHVINHPDSAGAACGFEQRGLVFSGTNFYLLPNYPHFRTGALVGSPCDTLGVGVDIVEAGALSSLKIFPNPSSQEVVVEWVANGSFSTGQLLIYNNLGQLLIQQTIQGASGQETLSLEQYPSGLYICKLYLDGQELHQEKLIIAK